jgi:hypothetical protein
MLCSNCKTPAEIGATYCGQCGSPLQLVHSQDDLFESDLSPLQWPDSRQNADWNEVFTIEPDSRSGYAGPHTPAPTNKQESPTPPPPSMPLQSSKQSIDSFENSRAFVGYNLVFIIILLTLLGIGIAVSIAVFIMLVLK